MFLLLTAVTFGMAAMTSGTPVSSWPPHLGPSHRNRAGQHSTVLLQGYAQNLSRNFYTPFYISQLRHPYPVANVSP
ncbi:unnamed protein product [Arctogadus glacialis]